MPESASARPVSKKKIVLAESEPLIIEILPQFLKPIGYEVIVSTDGESALQVIKRELPDLIILDSSLPKIDGLQLCQILKNDFITSYIPIVILIEKRQIRKELLAVKEGVDDYIIKPPDPIDLQVRLEMALRRTDHQVHADSLSRLPGNRAIEGAIRERIRHGKLFSFMHLDVDDFKSFNDTYGYLRGDGVILQVARIITDCTKKCGNAGDFVGHIGGDDFVVITTPDKEEALAGKIIGEFDRLIPLHYSEQDRLIGYLAVKDRQDNDIQAPLMSLSVAIVNNNVRKVRNALELTETVSEIKKYLKTVPGSKFLANRRTAESGAAMKSRAKAAEDRKASVLKASRDTLPIGQLLVKAKLIDENQLIEALFEHWSSRQLLGQTLIKMGLITAEDLAPFIAKHISG